MHVTPGIHRARGRHRLRRSITSHPLFSMAVAGALVSGVAVSSVATTNSDPAHRPVDPVTAKAASEAVNGLRADWFRGLGQLPAATPPVKRSLVRKERGGKVALTVTVDDIPPVPLAAYRAAAASLASTDPSCHLPWPLLAGIGGIESDHARSGGSTRPGWNGVASPPILGPLLDGSGGFAAVRDTDGGRLDGNAQWDRAVGPMQFLPSSWLASAADGNNDGVRNPEDMYDAALGAGGYLCRSGADLSTPRGLAAAVFSYNHSVDYVRAVLLLTARYARTSPAALGIVPQSPKGTGAAAAGGPTGTVTSGRTRLVAGPNKVLRPAVQTDPPSTAAAPATPDGSTTSTAGQTSQSTAAVPVGSAATTSAAATPTTPDPQPSSAPAPAVSATTATPTTVAPTTPAPSGCPSPTPTGSPSLSPSPSPTASPTASPTPSPCPS